MYYCNFCTFETTSIKLHIEHHYFHRNISQNYFCGYNRCKKVFKKIVYLNTHLHRTHGLKSRRKKVGYSSSSADSRGKFVCTIETCLKDLDNFNLLLKHLKNHIHNKQKITCPYRKCNRTYSKLSSFTGHLSKYHRSPRDNLENDLDGVQNSSTEHFDVEDVEPFNEVPIEIDEPIESENIHYDSVTELDLFLKSIAQFYLALECKLLIPASSVKYIITEINNIHTQGQEAVHRKLKHHLLSQNIELREIDQIITNLLIGDLWSKSHIILKTDFKRKKFYKTKFDYVEPIFVDIDKDTATSFAYVPILETVENIFKDKSMKNLINLTVPVPNNDILKDFTDGNVFRNNDFFKNNNEGIQIILYQDAFEIVNPIGPAKKKHKILAIYMSIGNIPDNFRSHINCIKLVGIVKEKEFKHSEVYGRIVQDLKILEDKGVEVNGKFIKGALVFITGDNLGSHGLGGFVENFSKAQYLCRFCLITRNEFCSDEGACKFYENRTIESYKIALNKIGNSNDFQGIKFDSIFNQLKNYHVCMPGLPPCLGHDLFEGVVAYDLLLYVNYFIKKKWFKLEYLNKKIDNFNYTSEDRKDKPCTISTTHSKIPGGACQIWNFLRLFPLLIKDKILDMEDEVWMCVLKLSELVEIICSPTIHKSFLPYLQAIIFDYISLRKILFPENNLRPKHHYLTHYPQLILQFGPLMKVWTMRFESKHRFFKRAIRLSLNFINVLKSLSVKHELFQCLIRLGGDIRIEKEVYDITNFSVNLYNADIQKCINNANLPQPIEQCNKVVIKGTTYQQGHILALRQEGYHYNLVIGKICMFFCYEEIIYVLCEVLENDYLPYLNAYKVGRIVTYKCQLLEEVLDYKPLDIYNLKDMLCIKPSHAFVSLRFDS